MGYMKEPDKNTDSIDRLFALIACRNKEIEELIEQNRNYLELIKSLVSTVHTVDLWNSESYAFLNDNKRLAEHFKRKMPEVEAVQGLESRATCGSIHAYVLREDYDKEAAKEALMDVHGRLCLEGAV